MVEARDNGNSNNDVPAREIRVNVFGRTDVGMVREHNEDSFLVADLSRKNRSIQPEVQNHVIGQLGSVFAVCDGMGGAAAGEVASKLGVDTIYEVLQASEPPTDESELAIRLNDAICEAGSRIYAESKANSARRGMGTTATVAVLINERLLFGQVGDSRAHIIRKGKLVQTTKDQSLVQQLIDANQLTLEEAKNFDRSNIILQALGTSEEVHVDITSTLLRRGDVLVICSDGLSGMVEPEDIRDVVLAFEDPADACQKLTQMACDNGGDDNITVIIAKFGGDGLDEPAVGDDVAYEKFMLPGLDDDDSITLPRGMPAIPGSAARAVHDARTKEEQARGKLPFFILLAVLTLAGMILFFTWNGNDSVSDLSSAAADSAHDANPPSQTVSASGKPTNGEGYSDVSDVGNAVLLAQETDMDFLGDTDTGDDSAQESLTGTDGQESVSDETTATDDVSAEVDSEISGGLSGDTSTEKNQVQAEDDSSLQSGGIKAGADSNAGKWARGKSKRKRKSEQGISTVASGGDDNASVDSGAADMQDSEAQPLSEETAKSSVDSAADKGTSSGNGNSDAPTVEAPKDAANDETKDSTSSSTISDENPY
ncbi:MAG: protein phosphatase 2C domain-containing protein [Deltaproteobacteria bacterium]|nr:protein phosphatase 2C domain-containing protein [Deltaproteobacteria bacterium]